MQSEIVRHFGLSADPFRARENASAERDRPLSDGEARRMLETRLAETGGRGVFARDALDRVVAAAGGRAQRLRWLAGLAMLEAALSGARTVTGAHAAAAIAQTVAPLPGVRSEHVPPTPPARSGRFAGLSLTQASAGAMLAMGLLLGVVMVGRVSVNQPPVRHVAARAHPAAPAQPDRTQADRSPPPVDATADAPTDLALADPPPARETAPPPPVYPVAPPAVRVAPVPSAQQGSGRSTMRPLPQAARDTRPPPPPAASLADADTDFPDAPPAERAPAAPRVFLHFQPPDREAASDLARRLESRGWNVAALREVDVAVRRPGTRFFYDADAGPARALARELSDETGLPARASDMRDYPSPPQPGTIEVWLPPAD